MRLKLYTAMVCFVVLVGCGAYNRALAQGAGCINVTQPPYNALGNGTTDDTSAISSALAAAPSQACLYFPKGKYKLSATITKTLGTGIASLGVYGDGADVSILYWSSATNGLSVAYTSPGNSVHIRDISFTTSSKGGGSALTLTQSSCLSAFAQTDIQRVTFRGDDNTGNIGSDYWNTAYLINGVSGTSVDTVTVYGAGNSAGIGGSYQGSSSCYSIYHNISKSTFNSVSLGVSYGSYVQGLTITQSNFQNDNSGLIVPATALGTLSQLDVANSQFANDIGNGISIASNVGQVSLIGNDFFTSSNSGIFLGAQNGCTIIGNSVSSTSLGTGYGIALNTNSTSQPCTIIGNTLINLSVGIWLQSGSTKDNVQSNGYINTTTNVLNSGTGNTVGGGSQ